MNMKLIILAALAYTMLSKRGQASPKPTEPAVKAPTQEEINKKLMEASKQIVKQAEDLMSSF